MVSSQTWLSSTMNHINTNKIKTKKVSLQTRSQTRLTSQMSWEKEKHKIFKQTEVKK